MRFLNISLEGPDCSGKTTLFNRFHRFTNFSYNVQDRSCMSMYVYSVLYGRESSSLWFEKIYEDLKRLDTLYVILLPEEDVLIERLLMRGDDFQDETSIFKVRNIFKSLSERFEAFDNVIVLTGVDLDKNVREITNRLDYLNNVSGKYLIKNLVKASGKNELCDVSCKEIVDLEALDMSVLDFPQEKEYYHGITKKIKQTVSDELAGRNPSGVVQDESSRRFIYSDDSCISMIHFLVRDNELNVKCVLRSSNVETTLWADYEFLKIISCKFLEWINKVELIVKLEISIRSAHIIP